MMPDLPIRPETRLWLVRGALGTLAALAVLIAAAATFIATRDYSVIERAAIARIETSLGAKLSYRSAKRILWAKPKLVLEDVVFAETSGRFRLVAPSLIVRFDLFDLLDGAVDNPSITVLSPEIAVSTGNLMAAFATPRSLAGLVEQAMAGFDQHSAFSNLRLALSGAKLTLVGADEKGGSIELSPVDATLQHTKIKGRIDIAMSRRSATRPLELAASLPTLGALGGARAAPASFQMSGYESRASFSGAIRRDSELSLSGRLEVSIGRSLEQMVFNRDARRKDVASEPLQLGASLAFGPRGASLETLRIARGARQLNGIAALREANGRWSTSATLAGDLVDGSAAHATLQRLRGSDGSWSTAPLAINPLPGIDLDVRLSTREFRLGQLVLGNVALSVLTRPGRAELAIIDSKFGDGGVKARISVADGANGQDLRLQASADRVHVGRFLEKSLGFSRLAGTGSLIVQAESRGGDVAALVANLSGSGAIDVADGEIVGIDLARLLARSGDGRTEAALIFALAGKTAFESFRVNLAIQDGRIEPIGSHFTSARVAASLEGAIDLPARRHQGAIVLRRRVDEPGQSGEFYAFRIEGPLFSPSIRPDPSILANRG